MLPLLLVLPAGASAAADSCAGSATDAILWECRTRELDAANARLDKAYADLLRVYRADEPVLAETLTAAQTIWTAFRESECRLKTYYSRGGTAYDIYWKECLTEMTDARTALLEEMGREPVTAGGEMHRPSHMKSV